MGALLLIIGVVLFIALALWLAWGASHFSRNIVGKLILAGVVLGFFYWVVFGRANLAEQEFKRLCEQEAGAKIYKTVQLPVQYFTEHGWVDFKYVRKPGVFNENEVAGRYVSITKDEEVSKEYSITKHTLTYKDLQTGETLGVATTFRYFGTPSIPVPGHVSAKSCPQTSVENWYGKVENQIFLRSQEINKE
jgi:hypothetical protein